jgi:8-oxo-dGTP diphosphatase
MEKSDVKQKNNSNQYSKNKIEIDCVVFNFDDDNLKVLLVRQKDNENWGLANDWIKVGETISGTARNILKKYIGVDNLYLEQLKAFGYSSQSSLQEDISIGYYAMIKRDHVIVTADVKTKIKWIDIDKVKGLEDKHKAILDYSVKELQKNICNSAIGFNLLPEKFTLLQVIHLYEEILGIEINKSNFRRKILQLGLILDANEKEEDVSHRAARLYRLNLEDNELLSHKELNFNFYKIKDKQ